MKLTAKIVSLWVAGTLVIVAAGTIFSVRHDVRLYQQEMRRDAGEIGSTLAALIGDAWRTSGEQRAVHLIADANRQNQLLNVRWVWLDRPLEPRLDLAPADRQSLRAGRAVFVEQREASGRGALHTYVPVSVGTAQQGALELTESLDALDRISRAALWRALWLGAVLLVGSGSAATILNVTLVGRPLRQLIDKTRRAGAGDLSQPVDLRSSVGLGGSDEFSELGVALNLMCNQLAAAGERLRVETEARIETLEQLRHADRLKTVGRLAGGMAHELGTPMNVVLARAELIMLEQSSESAVASAEIIKAQIGRMSRMIRQLLDFGRRGRARKQPTDLVQLAAKTLELIEPIAKRQNVTFDFVRPEMPVWADIDAGQIEHVLTNLVENAIQAMPQGGMLALQVEPGPFLQKGKSDGSPVPCAKIEVRDQGVGIAAENLPHIFDPFFTTKDVGRGTGLGLSIAYGIVQDHGGWIDVSSVVGQGSQFAVYLPRAASVTLPVSNNSSVDEPLRNPKSIADKEIGVGAGRPGER